jgi:hypothetical protein
MQCERKEIFNSLHHLHSIAAPTAAYRSPPKQGVYVRGAACLVGLRSMQAGKGRAPFPFGGGDPWRVACGIEIQDQ